MCWRSSRRDWSEYEPEMVRGGAGRQWLVVDDEADVAELFRQRFRREARQGIYVLHFACSGQEALDKLAGGSSRRRW